MKKNLIFILSGFLTILMSASCLVSEEQAQDTAEPMDVIIKGKPKDMVTIEKSAPKIDIDLESIISPSDDMADKFLEAGIKVPDSGDFAQFKSISSEQVTHPHLPCLSEPPLVKFLPNLSNVGVKSWELMIIDEKGDNIQTIKGKGMPVKTIAWDGLDRKGEIINVGSLYSFRFVSLDSFDKPYTLSGEAFTLKALKYTKAKKTIVEVDNKFLFPEDKSEFSEQSKLYMEKVADILREYSQYHFTIKLYVDDDNSQLSRDRRETLRNFIAEKLILLPEEVDIRMMKKEKRGMVTAFVIN